jgi:hypothetical protein
LGELPAVDVPLHQADNILRVGWMPMWSFMDLLLELEWEVLPLNKEEAVVGRGVLQQAALKADLVLLAVALPRSHNEGPLNIRIHPQPLSNPWPGKLLSKSVGNVIRGEQRRC